MLQNLFFASRFTSILSAEIRLFYFTKLLVLVVMMFSIESCQDESELTVVQPELESRTFEGFVCDAKGPVSGAIVRIQTTEIYTTTGDSGKFVLTGMLPDDPVKLTAWAPGYYISGGEAYSPGSIGIELTLVPHAAEDNPDYEWLSAFSAAGEDGNCQNCHTEPGNPSSALPFDEWRRDAHGQAAQNSKFLTMYLGTDIYGNQSPLTRYGYNRDYGSFPLRPDPNQPYYGPGYKLDFPATPGNCAARHTPAAAVNTPYGVNPAEVEGVGGEGVACDFCHKVWNVRLNPATGLPNENMPGVLSFEYRRPPAGHQFFAGPYDDVAPGEDVYSPIQKQSQYCAPCHFGKFWGTTVYNSFGEWFDSPYSNPQTGKTCQDCHMPSGLTDHFVRFDKGGNKRNPETIFSHRMPGAKDAALLRNAVTITVTAYIQGDLVFVNVDIINDQTGHHVPTDSPLRHLILIVQATDATGNELRQLNGSKLPDWCGVGDPDNGYYAGLAGKTYAKILEELWTGVSPTGAYWNMTRIVSDNRIPAMGSDRTAYSFAAPVSGDVTVEVQLIYRRAFIILRNWKGWDVSDIVMDERSIILNL